VRQRRQAVPHHPHSRSRRTASGIDHHRDHGTTTPATSVTRLRTSNLNASTTRRRRRRRRTILPVNNHGASRHHRSDGMTPVINRRRRRGAAPIHVFKGHRRGGLTPAQCMVALSLLPHLWWVVATGQEDPVEVGRTRSVVQQQPWRGFQGYGRGFVYRAEDGQPAERYADLTPRPGPNAESRPGRGRGRGRGCHVCGRFGCHTINHPEGQAAEFRQYEQPRSSSVPPDNRSQGNGPRSSPTGNRAPTPRLCPQSQ